MTRQAKKRACRSCLLRRATANGWKRPFALARTRFTLPEKNSACAAASPNFGPEELASAVEYAHAAGVRVYLTCNNVMRNEDFCAPAGFSARSAGRGSRCADCDRPRCAELARRVAPDVEIHISTQAGVTNWAAANAFYQSRREARGACAGTDAGGNCGNSRKNAG